MKRNVRKIAVILLAVMLFSALTMAAYAGTSQRDFSVYTTFGTFTLIGEEDEKDSGSDMFIKISSSNGCSSYNVRAMGCDDDGENPVNCTLYNGQAVSYVRCYLGTSYGIPNEISENNCDFATLSLYPNGPSTNTSGYWAPDTVANKYSPATP